MDSQNNHEPFSYERDVSSLASELVAGTEAAHEAQTEPISIRLRGLDLIIAPGVFNPALSNVGDLLAEYVHSQLTPDTRVLDMGTGSGFQALWAAQVARNVWGCDKQPEAVICAKANAARNNLSNRAQFFESNLFSEVPSEQKFDLILFNMPFVPWRPETPWQKCNFDFEHNLLKEFLAGGRAFLTPSGRMLITFADVGNRRVLEAAAQALGYTMHVASSRTAKGIAHYVIELHS